MADVGTQSNELTDAALDRLLIQIRRIKNGRERQIAPRAEKLIVFGDSMSDAQRVLKRYAHG